MPGSATLPVMWAVNPRRQRPSRAARRYLPRDESAPRVGGDEAGEGLIGPEFEVSRQLSHLLSAAEEVVHLEARVPH